MKIYHFLVFFFIVNLYLASLVRAQTTADWYMAGANPQRTSWVNTEVRGNLNVEWYQSIEPYIPPKVQPVFFNGMAYISTSRGLYAFDLTSTVSAGGTRLKWIYPTELPLGNSPTIATINGKFVAYVGGYDRKIHAVDLSTGSALTGYTPFEAGAGYDTNPLVINDSFTKNIPLVVAGNRDGNEYAFNAVTGTKVWQFATNGVIDYSSAYKNGVIYFASNDLYAYAINIADGSQKWKSQKFQYSAGFFSFWPMIYTDKLTGKVYVSFTGATNYRPGDNARTLNTLETTYFLPGCLTSPLGYCPVTTIWNSTTASSDPYFLNGTKVDDIGGNNSVPGIPGYWETYPYRHLVFILDANTGTEFTYDSNNNGKPEYAPFLWNGGTTYSGSKYPGMVNGVDNIYYQTTMLTGETYGYIPRSDPVGWKFGTNQISEATGQTHADDETMSYASGGKVLYWSVYTTDQAGSCDITLPASTSNRCWQYWWNYDQANLAVHAPGYNDMYYDGANHGMYAGKYNSHNGIYGSGGTAGAPPIPYGGKVYMIRENSFMAWSASTSTPLKLALAASPSSSSTASPLPTSNLKPLLEDQIQRIVSTGPLRPGYMPGSLFGNYSGNYSGWLTFDDILDYFSNPADTVYTLLMAYPYVTSTTQNQIKTYLTNYYGPGKTYDFTKVQHVGWSTGSSREAGTIPPDRDPFLVLQPATSKTCCSGGYWQFPPFNFYAAWKYSQIVGNNDPSFAKNIFNLMSSKIEAPANDTFLIQKPFFNNLYAAGYYGYLQLKQLAGLGSDATVQGYYDHVMNLRTNNFSKDQPFWPDSTWLTGNYPGNSPYYRSFSIANNFAFLTPEIGNAMKSISPSVQTAIAEYQYVAPFWFSNKFEGALGEGTIQHLYDTHLFFAKAWILSQPYSELSKYLDTPAFERGDLFYIQRLAILIQAAGNPTPIPTSSLSPTASPTVLPTPTSVPLIGDINGDHVVNLLDYTLLSNAFSTNNSAADLNHDGIVNLLDYTLLSNNFGKTN